MVLESNTLDVLFVKDGQQGEDGKILYTWIKYAKDASGTGMTDDPDGAIYIGISYNNESPIESNDPTHYAWTKIQGADGKKGEDAYTIFLENENISFATDENRNPLSEQAYTSGITIMKGAKPVTDYTIGNIAKTQGIAVAKTDTAIAISVVNGNPLPNDSGEIEIPITVGGTVFKKILTWTCAKKGEQGEKGNPGTSIKITSKSVTYQTSTSGTTAPTGAWVTTVPTVNNGQYLWTKTTVQYSDGNKTEAYSVSYKGTNGTNGTSVTVSKTEVTYQVSTSGTTAPTGVWSTTMPSCDQGQYLWTKTYVKYSDGKDTTSYSVSYKGVDGTDGQNATYITVSGTNFDAVAGVKDKASYLVVNGIKHNYDSLSRGHTLAVINPSNGTVESIQTYDTYKTLSALDEPLAEVESGKIICLFTADASSLTDNSRNTLIECGSGLSNTWYMTRTTHVFIGMKGLQKGQAYEVVGGATQIITAYYTNSGIVANGATGDKGQKGDNAKNLSITPSSQYFKSTDGGKTFAPDTITIKPTIQGEISFGKWQYSIDGGVSFTDVVSGQKGLTINNNVLTVSKDSSLYGDAVTMVTFRAVANDSNFYDTCSIAKIYDVTDIQIGGVNLIKNSNFADGINKWVYMNITCAVETDSTYGHHIKFSSSVGGDTNHRLFSDLGSNFNHVEDTMYTLSFYAKASANTQVQTNVACTTNKNNYSLTTSWQRFTFTYQASAAGSLTFWAVEANKDIYLANIKLERGNKATDWSPAPEDIQTAILSTKSEISDVSLKVDNNKQAIEQRVEKTTYQQDLDLVKGDINKANEGLNKWRYEIYPKSLFDSEDQSKSTIDIFARNLNLVPSQTVLLDDASLSTGMGYGDNHIAYALTFVKMSAKKDVTTKMFNDDGASLYVNGGLIITRPSEYTNGEEITFTLAQGWNCIEVVVNESGGGEGFRFSTTLSKLSECQMMNCYYGTPVARQSRITNQLVDVTKNLTGVTSTVQDVMTAVGNSGNITEFKNNYSKWKQNVDKIESRVGEKYVTNEKFDGLEIGGRNLLTKDDCNMSKWQNLYPAHCKVTNNDYSNHIDYVPTGGEWEIIYKKISITKGQKYILSFDYKVNKAYNYLSGQKYGVYLSTSVPANAAPANIITNGQYVVENTVTNTKRGIVTFTAPADTLYIVINGGCIDDRQTGLSFEFNKWKLEKGNKPTDWTPAPEDVNGKIVNVETIANQTAKKFDWIVKGGDSSSNFTLTDRVADLVAERINFKGLVTFSGTTNLIENSNMMNGLANITSECKAIKVIDDSTYRKALVITPIAGERIFWGVVNVWKTNITYSVSFVAKSSVAGQKIKPSRSLADWGDEITLTTSYTKYTTRIKSTATADGGTLSFSFSNAIGDVTLTNVKLETGMNPTDWSPAPGDYITQASLVRNWTTNTTWIDGGKVYTGSITADKIAANAITADKIATDAIKSRNYISSGGTQGSFLNLSDGSFTSPNLSWDSNGNLIAKNANLSGEINATEGSIGGWNIKDSLYSNIREPYDISKYYAKKILNKPSFTNICMNTNVLSAANYGTVGGDHVTIGDSLIATNTAYSFGVNISLGRISLFGSTYYTSDLASELNKSSSLSLSGDKISFWEYDEDGHEISEQNNTYITSNYARFSGDIFIGGDIGTDGGADIGGKLQASSIAAKNGGLIETAGTIYGGGEIQCGGGQMRIIGGDYGILLRNDGSDFYILSTDSGNQWGYWNSKRPFRINLANGIPYFEYGIIIPNENYLLGNGYQIARGTSWGGVCIGDDSKGLRFYGTSIWASHSISTSDENLKENFTTLDQYEDFYMNLNPIGFNYIGDYDCKKTHFGFGAHKTEDALESEGYDSDKFAVVTHRPLVQEDIEKRFGKDIDVDIETEYGVSYTEFIALNTHMIQKTRKELTKVKQEKADLEARLQAIEAKLGL